eukprot:g16749.t1
MEPASKVQLLPKGLPLDFFAAEARPQPTGQCKKPGLEADPLFCEALGQFLVLRGENDRDGRGVEVESCSALILHNAKCLRTESAILSAPSLGRRTRRASRDHLVTLLERPAGREPAEPAEPAERLVVCSVHLHPPQMFLTKGLTYEKYLDPLRRAIESLAGLNGTENEGVTLQTPCLLLGDFNLDPEHFERLTKGLPFWKQFQMVLPLGETAHHSNPSRRGDFALATGGQWKGRALGDEGFRAFERHARETLEALSGDILQESYVKAEQSCKDAMKWLRRAQRGAQTGHLPELPLEQLSSARVALQRASRSLRNPRIRRTLLNSDHRPLRFDGTLQQAEPQGFWRTHTQMN